MWPEAPTWLYWLALLGAAGAGVVIVLGAAAGLVWAIGQLGRFD